jgi:hypothetical protein
MTAATQAHGFLALDDFYFRQAGFFQQFDQFFDFSDVHFERS